MTIPQTTQVPAPVPGQLPPEGRGGAVPKNDAIKAKLTADLKETTRKREKQAAKAAGKGGAGKGGSNERNQPGKAAAGGKAGAPAPSRPKRGTVPDDDASAGKGGAEASDQSKGKASSKGGKGKAAPDDKHAAKREAARKLLEGDAEDAENLETAAGAGDDEVEEGKPRGAEAEDDDPDTWDEKEFKRRKRELAKHKRKTEVAYAERERKLQSREAQVEQAEAQINAHAREQVSLFKKDPLSWLKKHDVNVRDELVRYAEADGEDPKEKKLRELDERTKKTEERLQSEDAERAETEAQEHFRGQIYEAFEETTGEDYPNLWLSSTPERVASVGLKVLLAHYRATKEKLAPGEIFRILEEKLVAKNRREANAAKAKAKLRATSADAEEPPEQVRTVREPVSPEPSRIRRRASDDVTRRDTSIHADSYQGRSGSFDRDATQERMRQMARERLR